MKFARLKFIFILTLICFLNSCSEDDGKKGKATAEYFIQFKMDGIFKIFQIAEPGYEACGNCACGGISSLTSTLASLMVCKETEDFSVTDIQGLDGNSLEFSEVNFPAANLSFTIDGVNYDTQYAISQIESELMITDVSSDGEFGIPGSALQMFKVKGTFECTVRAAGGASDIAITEGKFTVRFSEN